jgi:non-ribosomal peptide synthetase component F
MGTTETGTATHHRIDKATQIIGSTVPAGYAVEDMEILILDEDGSEMGCNTVGEIAVKSRYVALGYWCQPDRTRTVFLPDPHGSDQRVYRTGDLGRLRPDGVLEHFGRKDLQVKVRGNRVEVAEIETALLTLGTVKEAVVTAQEMQPGEQRLVAYVVVTNFLSR